MSNLTHLFHVGQKVRCNMDGIFWDGTVKETYDVSVATVIDAILDEMYYNDEEWKDHLDI